MAAGKSSVAQALAERLPRSVHLRGDVFRRMVVSGREDMSAAPTPEALAQLMLRYRLAAAAASGYRAAGFDVIYQDVILGAMLEPVLELHERSGAHLVVLCPDPAVVAAREAARGKEGYHSVSVAQLDEGLRAQTPRLGYWLDSSRQSVAETVDDVLDHLDRARLDR